VLGAVQDAEHQDFSLSLKDLVNRDEWKRRESSATDCATRRAVSGWLSAM